MLLQIDYYASEYELSFLCFIGTPQDSGISLQTVLELGPSIPLFGVCMGLQCIGEAFGGLGFHLWFLYLLSSYYAIFTPFIHVPLQERLFVLLLGWYMGKALLCIMMKNLMIICFLACQSKFDVLTWFLALKVIFIFVLITWIYMNKVSS